MKKLLIAASVAGVILGQSALAGGTESQHWNEHVGPYIEANVGTNLYYAGVLSSQGSTANAGVTGFGWSGDAGYFFNKYVAAEIGFMQNYALYKRADVDKADYYDHTNLPYVAARFNAPIGDRLSFIGKVGLMYASAAFKHDKDDNVSSPSFVLPYTGIGLGYAVTPKLEANVQYQGAVYGIAGAGLMSAGLTYHF